jgi:hypothetical protein
MSALITLVVHNSALVEVADVDAAVDAMDAMDAEITAAIRVVVVSAVVDVVMITKAEAAVVEIQLLDRTTTTTITTTIMKISTTIRIEVRVEATKLTLKGKQMLATETSTSNIIMMQSTMKPGTDRPRQRLTMSQAITFQKKKKKTLIIHRMEMSATCLSRYRKRSEEMVRMKDYLCQLRC